MGGVHNPRLEYCCIWKGLSTDERWNDEMNLLGQDGWELVAVTGTTTEEHPRAYFKRKIEYRFIKVTAGGSAAK